MAQNKTSDPLAPYPDLTMPMVEELQVFLDLVDPGTFRNQLVQWYLKFISSQQEALPPDFKEITESMAFLLQFLMRVEQEMKQA